VLGEAGLDPDRKVKHGALAGDKEEREAIFNGLAGILHRLRAALGKDFGGREGEGGGAEEVMAVPLETESAKEEKEVEKEVMMAVLVETESADVDMEVEEVEVTAVPIEMESAEEGKVKSELTEERPVPPMCDEMDSSTGCLVEPVKVAAIRDAGPMEAHHARTERLASVQQGLDLMRAWAEADPEAWRGAADEGERAVIPFCGELLACGMTFSSASGRHLPRVLIVATQVLLGLAALGEGVRGGAGARGTGEVNNRIPLPENNQFTARGDGAWEAALRGAVPNEVRAEPL
jgi:hypothetical protein